ncbi:MAG TPA: class I SAM-dependent methyltransferase [Chitinophagaceae bacterium]|nr:class I SAM-dependent methyltransferase [Chitinophagaceae bacterium]
MKQNIINLNHGEWFKHWFDSSFYHKLYANRDEKEASHFLDALLQELSPADHSQMLDLGCGNGRHSKHLASKGFKVTGIDLSASSIRNAKRWESPKLEFYRHDMRLPFGNNCFDYVFNFFTSFGYFKNSGEDYQVLNNISSSLKPGGILVMDYINTLYAEKRLVPEEKNEIDGIVYHITRWTDESYFYKKIILENSRSLQPVEFTEQVTKFSISDFDCMFKKCNLRLQQVYGDYQLGEYDIEKSPRLILVARKPNN